MRLTLKAVYPAIFEKHPWPWYRYNDGGVNMICDANVRDVLNGGDNAERAVGRWLFELYLFVMPVPAPHRLRYDIVIPSAFRTSPLPWVLSRGADGRSAIYNANCTKVTQWHTGDVHEEARIALYEFSLMAERKLGIRRT